MTVMDSEHNETSDVLAGLSSQLHPRKAYAGRSGRELSKSAAKRQSVVTLGSIRHLQHQYAKGGLAAAKAPQAGLPLAIPGQRASGDAILEEDLPPSPSPPPIHAEKSFEVGIPSLRLQRQAVFRELADVCELWGIIELGKALSSRRESSTSSTLGNAAEAGDTSRASMTASPMPSEDHGDNLILHLLNTTTSAIRTVQKYFTSLPPEKLPFSVASTSSTFLDPSARQAGNRGVPSLGVVTASRPIPRHSQIGVASSSKRSVSSSTVRSASGAGVQPLATGTYENDGLLRLRKTSIAALGALKQLDAQYRLPLTEEPDSTDDLYENMHELSLSSAASTTSSSVTFNFEDTSASASVSSEASSQRTDPTRGHLYRDDVSLRDLAAEAEIVREWMRVVDALLAAPSAEEVPTPRLRTKSGNLEPREARGLPSWACEEKLASDPMGCLNQCIRSHLPSDLLQYAALADASREDTLASLSDGQFLCTAYNLLLRKSQRPWGFMPQASIHDVISLTRQRERDAPQQMLDTSGRLPLDAPATGPESLKVASSPMRRTSSEGLSHDGASPSTSSSGVQTTTTSGQRVGLTFRRLDNLRLFVAAVRLRYLIQFPSSETDIKIIARKEQGWESLLTSIAMAWLSAVAEEKRAEEMESD